jgi:hypothetical protein
MVRQPPDDPLAPSSAVIEKEEQTTEQFGKVQAKDPEKNIALQPREILPDQGHQTERDQCKDGKAPVTPVNDRPPAGGDAPGDCPDGLKNIKIDEQGQNDDNPDHPPATHVKEIYIAKL